MSPHETADKTRVPTPALDAIARCLTVICLVSLILGVFRLFDGLDVPFLAYAVAGAALVHATQRPAALEIALTSALAIAFGLIYASMHGRVGAYPGASLVAVGAFLGLASTVVLGWRACRANRHMGALLAATFCPVLLIFTNLGLALAIQLSPKVFDSYLYRFDAILGPQASFLAGQLFLRVSFLRILCFHVYSALPLAEVLALLLYLRGRRMPVNPVVAFATAGVAGFLLYQICPAAGPIHVFGSAFPFAPPANVLLEASPLPGIPRNAIPSLHSAWVILIWWNVRRCAPAIRWSAAGFALLTLLATLGLGEHYLIDLIVAVPFAAAVQAACAKRWRAAITGFLLTAGWVVYLRHGLPMFAPGTAVAWAAVVATIGVAAGLMGLEAPSFFARKRDLGGLARLSPQ